jgi:group II intron reverse transcriptase/maturase
MKAVGDVVRYLKNTLMSKKVNYVLEADIKGFFDNVDHDWLLKFLEHDIADPNFLRYIKRFLMAGVMEGTDYKESDKGTPQGGLISPVLANVYLHYVLDLWVEKRLKKTVRGEVYYVRYADDFVLMFQYDDQAEKALSMLKDRLEKFGLEVAPEKTRILPIGRFRGTKESFDFLGFTFYNAKTRSGKYTLGVRTSLQKLKAKKSAVKAWLKYRLDKPIGETMKHIAAVVRGHCNYYGINGNGRKVLDFWEYLKFTCYRLFNRRSQKRSMGYEKFYRIWNYHVKRPRITVAIWT